MKMSRKLIVSIVALCCLCNTAAVAGNAPVRAAADTREEVRYYDTYSISTAVTSETVTYDRKEETVVTTDSKVPIYYNPSSSLTNACGAVAGSIVVGFYDRYYEQLIPNYTSYMPAINRYKPFDSTYVMALLQDLYVYMRTNVEDVGVSKTECLDGLEDYVNDKGLDIAYSGVKNALFGFNYNDYKTAINNDKPVMLFCQNLPINNVTYMDNEDTISEVIVSGNHIVVGYGYYEIKYYNGNNNFRTDRYLMVANGQAHMTTGYIDISDDDWCMDGYAVTIS